jgi:hypothetical protein
MLEKPYHVFRNGSEFGPFSASELRELKERGQLRPDDLIWTPGMAGSVPAANVGGLYRPAGAPVASPQSCPAGVVPQRSVAIAWPPRVVPPPAPLPTAANSVWRPRVHALANKTAALGKRAFYEACITAQAILLQTSDFLRYLASKARPADRQPLAIAIDPATRLRARVGGTILLLAALMLIDSESQTRPAVEQESNLAKTSADAPANDEQWHDAETLVDGSKTSGNTAEQRSEAEKTETSVERKQSRQSTLGIRVPVHSSGSSVSRYPQRWPGAGRQYGSPSLRAQRAGSDYDAQTDYARQQAIVRAQEAQRRAERNYRSQISGYMGAQGLQYIPADRSPYRSGGY